MGNYFHLATEWNLFSGSLSTAFPFSRVFTGGEQRAARYVHIQAISLTLARTGICQFSMISNKYRPKEVFLPFYSALVFQSASV